MPFQGFLLKGLSIAFALLKLTTCGVPCVLSKWILTTVTTQGNSIKTLYTTATVSPHKQQESSHAPDTNACANASLAEMRSRGFTLSIAVTKERASNRIRASTSSHASPPSKGAHNTRIDPCLTVGNSAMSHLPHSRAARCNWSWAWACSRCTEEQRGRVEWDGWGAAEGHT